MKNRTVVFGIAALAAFVLALALPAHVTAQEARRWIAVSLGGGAGHGHHTVAIRTDGTIWRPIYESGWGWSYEQVVSGADWAYMLPGRRFLRTDGSLWLVEMFDPGSLNPYPYGQRIWR